MTKRIVVGMRAKPQAARPRRRIVNDKEDNRARGDAHRGLARRGTVRIYKGWVWNAGGRCGFIRRVANDREHGGAPTC